MAVFLTASPCLGRDPKSAELPEILELAGWLKEDAEEAYGDISRWAGHPGLKAAVPYLRDFMNKTAAFIQKIQDSDKSPWRVAGAYRDLNESYAKVQQVFIHRPIFGTSPYALSEIAFSMEDLEQYFLYPQIKPGQVFYSVPYPLWPPVFAGAVFYRR